MVSLNPLLYIEEFLGGKNAFGPWTDGYLFAFWFDATRSWS